MATGALNFGPNQESGHEALAGASPYAFNVIVDAKGATRRRPGIEPFGQHQFSGPVQGLYVNLRGEIFAYVAASASQRRVYRVASDGSAVVDVSGALGLTSTRRPTWAETEAMMVIADGTNFLTWKYATSQLERMPNDPPLASHVIANSLRLAGNNLDEFTNYVTYSALASGSSTAGNEVWLGDSPGGSRAGSFSAESRPDPLVALHENTNELFLFGKTSLQVFAPDASFVYAPVTTREVGCSAPYSVIKTGQLFAWLDHERRFVLSDGRSQKVLSDPIQQTLDSIETIDDCVGHRISTGPVDCLVWRFPSDGRTFCYQLNGGWAQWSGWDAVTGERKSFVVESSCIDPAGGRVLVGTRDGRLGVMQVGANADLGEPVAVEVATGFEDRKSTRRKLCKAVRLTLRRGGASSASDRALLSYRDDTGPWSHPQVLELGPDTGTPLVLRALGVYRSRQWRLQFYGTGEYVLASAEEDFDILEQ